MQAFHQTPCGGGIMSERERVVRLAGGILEQQSHVCAFFHSLDEQDRVLLPFIKEGIEQGERAFHVVDPGMRTEHIQRLEAAGIDMAAAERRGQLEIRGWDEAYLQGNRFDLNAWLRLLEAVVSGAYLKGPLAVRIVADMGWALEDLPGVDDLMEYEARLNTMEALATQPQPIVCTYDLAKFGAGLVIDALRTHPTVLPGRMLRANPFFMSPQEFLQELRERASHDQHR
jgi:hypothetical protein